MVDQLSYRIIRIYEIYKIPNIPVTYPIGPIPPPKKPSDLFLEYRKWYILTTIPIAIVICYIIAEKGIMILLFGTQMLTTFPYSFIFTLILFGALLWLFVVIVMEEIHSHLSDTK